MIERVFLCRASGAYRAVRRGKIINTGSVLAMRAAFKLREIMPMIHYSVAKKVLSHLPKRKHFNIAGMVFCSN